MIAREWKDNCPIYHKEGFIKYLYQTGIKESSEILGFKGTQIFNRNIEDNKVEITLISCWESLESIKAFAGDNIEIAKLYPEGSKYELEPDNLVVHYEVIENHWL